MVTDSERLDALEDPLGTQFLYSSTKTNLPTGGLRNGAHAFCEDGRGPSEASGAGTGVPVWAKVTAGAVTWIDYRTGAEVLT